MEDVYLILSFKAKLGCKLDFFSLFYFSFINIHTPQSQTCLCSMRYSVLAHLGCLVHFNGGEQICTPKKTVHEIWSFSPLKKSTENPL